MADDNIFFIPITNQKLLDILRYYESIPDSNIDAKLAVATTIHFLGIHIHDLNWDGNLKEYILEFDDDKEMDDDETCS